MSRHKPLVPLSYLLQHPLQQTPPLYLLRLRPILNTMHPNEALNHNRKLRKHLKGPSLSQLNKIKKTIFIFHIQSIIFKKRGCGHRSLPPPNPYLKESEKHPINKFSKVSKVVTVLSNYRKRKGIKRSQSLNNTPRSPSHASASAAGERLGDDEMLEFAVARALERGTSINRSRSFNVPRKARMSCSDLPSVTDEHPLESKEEAPVNHIRTEMEQIKEKFSKLLLGEDMSGGGKGVSSALALSNAITNLAASVFGEQSKLEPMPEERKTRWRKEIEWLLCATDHIVEMVPVKQTNKDGTCFEVMSTQQRKDIMVHIPALRQLDNMLIDILDNFGPEKEFWYVSSKDAAKDSQKGAAAQRNDEKWWVPTPRVPDGGLSEKTRRWLYSQKEDINQVLKVAMNTNAHILSEMEIPESYLESLPKNGKSSLGESIYKSLSVDTFDPEQFLASMKFSTEHKVLDLKNRLEACIVIWKRKMNHQKDAKSSRVSLEKREQFEERAESILHLIKLRFPGLPQSTLEISKIQFNKDVGQAVLESYSRIIESLASKLMSRIDDVLYSDLQIRETAMSDSSQKSPEAGDQESEPHHTGTPTSVAHDDNMNWPAREEYNGMESTPDSNLHTVEN